jgi:hypothetical protein
MFINKIFNVLKPGSQTNHFKSNPFIFCINTGRAGSDYLAKLLGSANNVLAQHEPDPKMIGHILQLVTSDTYENTYLERFFKVEAIENALKASGKNVYIETSHMFIKTFFDLVANEFRNVNVIFLNRSLVDTLQSFCELGYFTNFNDIWPDWMISPYAKTAAIECAIPEEEQDSIGLAISYLIDIHARALRFKRNYTHIPVIEIELGKLNNIENVIDLFDRLNIKPTEATRLLVGQKQNARVDRKIEIAANVPNRQYLQQRIVEYLQKLEAKGIKTPSTLIL